MFKRISRMTRAIAGLLALPFAVTATGEADAGAAA